MRGVQIPFSGYFFDRVRFKYGLREVTGEGEMLHNQIDFFEVRFFLKRKIPGTGYC